MSEVISEHIGKYKVTTTKAQIGRLATQAAAAGKSIDDACPYPYGTECATHFKAVYLLAKPLAGEISSAKGNAT